MPEVDDVLCRVLASVVACLVLCGPCPAESVSNSICVGQKGC